MVKHLLGETDSAEASAVASWIAVSEENAAHFDELKKVWDTSRSLAAQTNVDVEKSWMTFRERIRGANDADSNRVTRRMFSPAWRIAASVILVAGLLLGGWWIFNRPQVVVQEMVVARNVVTRDTLPDGSRVTLNKHARISYPSAFRGKKRPVKLEGEAFFEVTPDKQKPFVITVNDVEITVVGTSFNVRSVTDSTEVVVESGIVRVTKGHQVLELKAGERIAIPAKSIELKKQVVTDRLYKAYESRIFECDNTPLWKVVAVINEAYDANIVIRNDALKAEPINVTFDNKPLEEVLNILKKTATTIKAIRKEGNQIILE